jgi:hypothetical protein
LKTASPFIRPLDHQNASCVADLDEEDNLNDDSFHRNQAPCAQLGMPPISCCAFALWADEGNTVLEGDTVTRELNYARRLLKKLTKRRFQRHSSTIALMKRTLVCFKLTIKQLRVSYPVIPVFSETVHQASDTFEDTKVSKE